MRRLAFLLAALAVAGPGWAGDVPAWLTAVAATPATGDTGRAVVLLAEKTVSVSPSGKTVTTERRALRILRRDGSDEAFARVGYDSE